MPQFDFVNRNGQTLTGRLELSKRSPRAFAIFAHCFTCSKNVRAATQVSRGLADHGIAVLRFDFTGLGNSDGDFANSDFSSNVTDLIDAAAALQDRYTAPSLLVGHSLGGAAVLMAAAEIQSIYAVATIGAPSEPAHVEHLIDKATSAVHHDGSATIQIGGRELQVGRQFVDDLKSNRIADSLPKLRKPLLVFHSPIDEIVSIENARRLFEEAKHPKSFVAIDDADHMLTDPEDAQFVAAMLATWAARHLPAFDNDLESAESVPHGVVEVVEQSAGLTQRIRTPKNEFTVGESSQVRGDANGPTPHELLLASLGACTSMTLRTYANRKKWPLKSIRIYLSRTRIHADACKSCEATKGHVDQIEKRIVISGDLNETQVDHLSEVAGRCPVLRTLMNEKTVLSRLELTGT